MVIVSELVSNAIRVGGPVPVDMCVTRWSSGRPVLRIDVVDGGRRLPARTRWGSFPDDAACHGRGLPLVDMLADQWGSEHRPDGHHVWACVRDCSRDDSAGAVA
ncbi:ATP-binding protein [Streptomyces sp. NPDC018833]|uniref:ATP-binding protein n=1 Tax=Streptomyces sp. NPDC018833 TaxID=3365053 RepID=UPI0037AE36D4